MFDRLQKPFLTVETGEAYQPIRLTFTLQQKEKLIERLNSLKCCEKNPTTNSWNWFWKDECNDLHFESISAFKKKPDAPLRLGTLSIRDNNLYINLPTFKRACLAVPFFDRMIDRKVALVSKADFINKVFGTDERLPHGFAELFKEEELEKIVRQRIADYEKIEDKVGHAQSAEEAFTILNDYTIKETKKRLPFAERYVFENINGQDPDIIFLGFYIFLRGRELVAIRRWTGEIGITLSDVIDETLEEVFGEMSNIDIIE